MQENTIPWVIKAVPAVVGAILALVLSGDIDKNGKIQVSMGLSANSCLVSPLAFMAVQHSLNTMSYRNTRTWRKAL